MTNPMKGKLDKVLEWKANKPKTDQEWALDVREERLDLKHDYQLQDMLESLKEKIVFAERRQMLCSKYPDAVKRDIEERAIMMGKSFDLNGKTLEEFVLAQAEEKAAYDNWKAEKIRQSIERIEKEIDLRKRKVVERTPIGTTYYIDFVNGSDGNTGTASDQAWATLDKFTENARSSGDMAIVRRGMTQTVSSDLTFTSTAAYYNPIKMEADFDDVWGDFTDSAQTYTIAWGSKTLTASATITGISAGDWIYNSTDGDDAREYAYEVASVSGTTLTLYLPFKGSTGAGKTLKVMPYAPTWNTVSGNYMVDTADDNNWRIQGMHFKGADSYGVLRSGSVFVLKDCILENDGTDECLNTYSDGHVTLLKCRLYEYYNGWGSIYYPPFGKATDCLFDAGTIASYPNGVYVWSAANADIIECEFVNNYNDISVPSASPDPINGTIRVRNPNFSASSDYVSNFYEQMLECGVEDWNQTAGDNRYYRSGCGDVNVIQSETSIVRSGGGESSVKVTPNTYISTYENAKVLLFEYPIYADTSNKTYTAYFKSSGTANWTNDPTADELWIELEYWGDATNKYRKIVKSTGICDFNGDDTTWHSLTVSAQPAIAGVAYLRCWYAKPKESAKSNIFYADTKVEIT